MLHKTDIQSGDIIQQFEWMFKYIDAKLMQTNCRDVALNEYENHLVNLQLSLNKCEIHQNNRKSANLVRKIRTRINGLMDKIKNIEAAAPELLSRVVNDSVDRELAEDNEGDDDENDDYELNDDSVFDNNY